MAKKLADDLMHKNVEYTKLKRGLPDDVTPRENPDHQSPGRRGLQRPALESWTTPELRAAARELNLDPDEALTRSELIPALSRSVRR